MLTMRVRSLDCRRSCPALPGHALVVVIVACDPVIIFLCMQTGGVA